MHRPNRILTGVLALVLLTCHAIAVSGQTSSAVKPAPSPVVNLNTATVADLQELPGIGARTAERIIEFRQKNGGFKKIEDLMNVKGIGEKSFLKLKSLVTVSPQKVEAKAAAPQID